jgi:RNA polymerase-interacting CarD/CdnL/TRCF family regulator
LDNPRFHRLASQELIQEAIEILQSDPNDFGNDPVQWKERIDDVQSEGDFLAISSLIRDLSAMKTKKKLNRIQDQALNNLEDRLLREWAASLEVDVRSIRPMLHGYLNKRNTDIQEAA